MFEKKDWKVSFLGLSFFLVFGVVAYGQATGDITGTVTDPSGAVIPNGKVTAINEGTSVAHTTTTTSAGIYRLPSLSPGKYTLKVEAAGFKPVVNTQVELTVGYVQRVDFHLEVGATTQTITVESQAQLVSTEEGRVSHLVSGGQVQNMPLNGRNVYELMQLIPGAVNSTAVNFEQGTGGFQTNINGNRANFNGFLLDGVSNKGLSGGSNSQPAPDFIQEFRIATNNFSAQYGNSAGSITEVSVKSGTNDWHGGAFEFFRNDKLNARNFFSDTRDKWRQNQFGGDIGGPIKRNKIFIFGGYEAERFSTTSSEEVTTETPAYRNLIQTLFPNSTAALLYKNFPAPTPTFGFSTVEDVANLTVVDDIGATLFDGTNAADAAFGVDAGGNGAGFLTSAIQGYADPCFLSTFVVVGNAAFPGGPNWGNAQALANKFSTLLGVTAAEQAQIQQNINTVAGCSGFTAPGVQNGALARTDNLIGEAFSQVGSKTKGQFLNNDQFTVRGDFQGDKLRIFGRGFHSQHKDPNGVVGLSAPRGFNIPTTTSFPSAALGIVYTISPTMVNEFTGGFTRNQLSNIPDPANFGVPDIAFDSGEVKFGAYNGYPQFFIENVFHLRDMVTWVKGRHSIKAGIEGKRNQENSEFDVGRPSYYFFDQLYFATDLPYDQSAGVNPELLTGQSSHLDTNIRAWRNYELGWFVQDDWKVANRLTLNLGVRWDYFSPHVERFNKVTQFNFASSGGPLAGIVCQASDGVKCLAPAGNTQTPNGGFSPASQLFKPDRNNFSPRFGFAWDPRGDGKTSIRGGFAIQYESTLFNGLSNSRWNLPFYSFNEASPFNGLAGLPEFGPTNPDGTPNTTATSTFSGSVTNPGGGPEGAGFAGNIAGWFPGNPNLAALTGIPDPDGLRTPYVINSFFGVQHQLSPSTVLEVNWVGNYGRKLFWAENPNRVVNGKARPSLFDPCTGQTLVESDPGKGVGTGLINPCFGTLRTWKNSVNSTYNALQVSMRRRTSRGLAFTSAYTWSHSIDLRSSWHALTSGGSATEADPFGSSGYSLDPTKLFLERGNSLFDIRHRWVTAVEWELPWYKSMQGVSGKLLGGWQTNAVFTIQGGFPFTVGAKSDFNNDGIRNDRPDIPSFGNSVDFSNSDFLAGSGTGDNSTFGDLVAAFPTPSGTNGTLGRNTFRGPNFIQLDFSMFKNIPITERLRLQIRSEFFNMFNHTNLFQPESRLDKSAFGLSREAFDPRVIQFALKLNF